jgi:hypothetical protein
MVKKVVEETFKALFALTDLRQILRETKPTYKLDKIQREKVNKILDRVRQSLDVIDEELI